MRSWLGLLLVLPIVAVACGDGSEGSSGTNITVNAGGKGGKGGTSGGAGEGAGGQAGSSSTSFPGGSGGVSASGASPGGSGGNSSAGTSAGGSPFGGGGGSDSGGTSAAGASNGGGGQAGAPPTGPCVGRSDGSYCGEDVLAQPGSVIVCSGENVASSQSCSDGCKNGQCLSDAIEPCFNDPDGWYCGSSIGGDGGYRYHCVGKVTDEKQPCPEGCEGGNCKTAAQGSCAGKVNGYWCGENQNTGAAGHLYLCKNGQVASDQACPNGCQIMPAGTDDACKAVVSEKGYYLPYNCGSTYQCTQGHNTNFSHNGKEAYAWDFGMSVGTTVVASRAGKVSHADFPSPPGSACYNGGGSDCANFANRVVIDHGDGQSTAYYHMSELSVSKGQQVNRGQQLGKSGNSGWSTGAHLHFMVMQTCGSWYCQSIDVSLTDAGVPNSPSSYTSGNCP